jgi:hypothetical protein
VDCGVEDCCSETEHTCCPKPFVRNSSVVADGLFSTRFTRSFATNATPAATAPVAAKAEVVVKAAAEPPKQQQYYSVKDRIIHLTIVDPSGARQQIPRAVSLFFNNNNNSNFKINSHCLSLSSIQEISLDLE